MTARPDHPLGVVPGLSNEAYHAGPGLSNSALGALAKCPAYYHATYVSPDRPRRNDPTPAMQAGTLAHCAVLEPYALASRYVVKPDGMDGRTVGGKAFAAEVLSRGLIVVSEAQMATALAQRAAVLAVPELAALLSAGQAEQSAYWHDRDTGTLCKCRPDWVHPLDDGRVIVLDLKTTSDVSPQGFGRSVWSYGYHRQDAHYSTGYAEASGREVAAFVFAAVSSEYPYIAQAYMLDDEAKARGAAECRRLIDLHAECVRTDAWPAYGSGVQLLSLPAWATK